MSAREVIIPATGRQTPEARLQISLVFSDAGTGARSLTHLCCCRSRGQTAFPVKRENLSQLTAHRKPNQIMLVWGHFCAVQEALKFLSLVE